MVGISDCPCVHRNSFVAKFLVPGGGEGVGVDKVNSAIPTDPPGYTGWRAGTATLSRVNYIPQSGANNLATGFNPSNRLGAYTVS